MAVIEIDRVAGLLLAVVVATAAVVIEFTRRALQDDARRRRMIVSMVLLTVGSALVIAGGHEGIVLAGWIGSGWALVPMLPAQDPRAPDVRRSTRRSLLVGDVSLTSAVLLQLFARPDPAVEQVTAVLIVVAGLSRSALVPFHRWLIGTITAPTPVSAIVHAGLVSGAGLLILRYLDLFVASPVAVVLAATAAVSTVVVATRTGAARPDAKGALAWSTVAQMAVMVLQCSVGAFSSAVVHIAGHGMYKASRFLGVAGTVGVVAGQTRTTPVSDRRSTAVFAAVTATTSVGAASVVVPPDLVPAGRLLVLVLAWSTVFAAVRGWSARRPTDQLTAHVIAVAGAFFVAFSYFGALRLVESFLKPDLPSVATVIGPEALALLMVLVVAVGVRPAGRGAVRYITRSADVASLGAIERSEVRSDVALAAAAVAPLWPLSSFVAVNPLSGLEGLGFDGATERARRWTGGRTHLTLADYRADHELGATRLADLEYVVLERLPEVAARPAGTVDGRLVDPVQIITLDLLHGPEEPAPSRESTPLERLGRSGDATTVDVVVADLVARYVLGASEDFVATALTSVFDDVRLRRLLDDRSAAWLGSLGADPVSVVAAASSRLGIVAADRVEEFRRQLLRLPGWVGHAKWRSEWAPPSETAAMIAPIDVLAVRLAVEAAVAGSGDTASVCFPPAVALSVVDPLDARVDAVAAHVAPGRRRHDLDAIRSVLALLPSDLRPAIWLAAQERAFDERFLTVLGRVDPGRTTSRPGAQAVFCIDVRSERFRRHLEDAGSVETFGFAGFFGLPVDVRRIGWDRAEPRCPVLVTPAMTVTEHLDPVSLDLVTRRLHRSRYRSAFLAAHDRAKKAPGAPYALAEALGWFNGPAAAWRTFRPGRASPVPARPTRLLLDDRVLVDQKVFAAESILRTMGLVDGFAPVVLLCGHTSRTVNNAHAAALDCGACGGASGEDNALAVAGLLNAPDVRHGLTARGIAIPDDTWFVAGVHDTASDRVVILDHALAPDSHLPALDRLVEALDRAGEATARERARSLPGPAAGVRDRGVDWAQIRPEWGLAGAASFVIAPRSTTVGLDLDGRAFLHGYDAAQDPEGTVLETIMTAPLIVAHWITSQYYFSTVDPEVFGAGDKLVHNPVGRIGVVSGDGGDLRVGLPLQSTHLDGRRHHRPLRLLAVIQAELGTIERIIARHRILQTLVGGSWIRIAARSQPHEPWSIRTPAGTWITHPRPVDTVTSLATSLSTSTADLVTNGQGG